MMAPAQPGLTIYEHQQLMQLRLWQSRPPGLLARGFAHASSPATRLIQVLVPETALRLTLATADALARRMATKESVLRLAGVDQLSELRAADMERCDELAGLVQMKAVGLSAVSGAAMGVAGAAGLALDVPALLTLSLHAIHRTGLCYGYDCLANHERHYAIGVFALASANTAEEKRLAIEALRQAGAELDLAAARDGLERAAQREVAKETIVFSLHNLSRQLGLNLTRRKATAMLPVLGAVVGGAVNAWYLRDLAHTARYAFHARRFAERGVI